MWWRNSRLDRIEIPPFAEAIGANGRRGMSKVNKIDWRRGLFRLWVVGTIAWILICLERFYQSSCNEMHDLSYGYFVRCYEGPHVTPVDYTIHGYFGWMIWVPAGALVAIWLSPWIGRGFQTGRGQR